MLELARAAGFDLAGIAPLAPPPDGGHFETWLASGHHADMGWLERSRDRILDPAKLVGGAPGGSILTLGLAHARPPHRAPDGSRVARYALGRDYHNVIGKRLKTLRRSLVEADLLEPRAPARAVVDAGPVLERSHAARAGLGAPSKAANLLHPDFGPFFFLSELILPLELEPTAPRSTELPSCGGCTACLDACPTGAIRSPGEVDARLCISYQTIENRGSIPRELRAAQGPWLFGCDVCSEVCPYGKEERLPDLSERFGVHRAVAEGELVSWLELDDAGFESLTPGSPLRRAKRTGMARNAAIVLGNVPSERGRRALLRALRDPAAPVREAAGWALMQGHGDEAGSREAVEAARDREADADVGRDLELDLERAP